jgi:sporulation protein YlmC with PRC-barrel domain
MANMVNRAALAILVAGSLGTAAYAQQGRTTGAGTPETTGALTSLPREATTVTNWYKQTVYDPTDHKIGEISDVLVDNNGQIEVFIVSVGGFLGIGEKDVAVPFNAVHGTQKNGKWTLTMTMTKDALQQAPGYKYDRAKGTWVPA